jgi:hypothetical protein
VHFGGDNSIGEFLTYFDWVLTNIGVVTFTVCFYLQEKYAEEVLKIHFEGYDWQNAPIDTQVVYASEGKKAHGRCDVICFSFYEYELRSLTLNLYFS